MRVLGIDPGLNGGAAVVEIAAPQSVVLLGAVDLPTIGEDARRRVDAVALRAWIVSLAPTVGVIERAQAMPDQGASSGFIYGRAVGTIEATVRLSGCDLKTVEAQVWKRALGLAGRSRSAAGDAPPIKQAAAKDAARLMAIEYFGDRLFHLKKHHNRAEAALIARFAAINLFVAGLGTTGAAATG